MPLSDFNIRETRKLSLKDTVIPSASELSKKVISRKPEITSEDIAYSKLLEKNPLIESLVNDFGLVNKLTGEELKTVNPEQVEPVEVPAVRTPGKIDRQKLISISQQVISESESCSKETFIERLQSINSIDKDRASKGFELMLKENII